MQRNDLHKYNLPEVPGVYLFKQGRKVLYVGKATSLRDRVRSYFDNDLIATRGPRIVDMVTLADRVAHEPTPTVLEALVREAALIRHYDPPANAIGLDDKSFLYVVITEEEIPRVLALRGTDLDQANGVTAHAPSQVPQTWRKTPGGYKIRVAYGPFPSGAQLRAALRLIQKIFPFFDTPKPVGEGNRHHEGRIEFNRQIGHYPRDIDRAAYRRSIQKVMLFLSGRGRELRRSLEKEMKVAAQEERFEDATVARRQLFALDHVQDVSLIKDEHLDTKSENKRIEAYDTAHLAGTNAIGVMTVVEEGRPVKKEYRTFLIRGIKKNDDVGSLKEVLSRRLNHPEWPFPEAIVVDGGAPQRRAAASVLAARGFKIPVASVVKDERHRPREVIGARGAGITDADAVLANAEAHRFSLSRHRRMRTRGLRK
jgi:excinuclease ABC subunit C